MRSFVAVVLFSLTAVAAIAAPEESVDLVLPPALKAQCDAEGGCVLVTRQRLEREVDALAEKIRQSLAQEVDGKCARESLRSI